MIQRLSARPRRPGLALVAGVASLAALALRLNAASFPTNFQESTIFGGLAQPTVVKFASDGRVLVAEKSGLVKVFASLSATAPTVFADLRTSVDDYWDRGLLGMVLHPGFPSTPYVFVLYTLDQKPGGTIPSWGDACPGPGPPGAPAGPGPTSDGCTVAARLSRLEPVSGTPPAGCALLPGGAICERVLLEGWCQQFPSHSIGALAFGPDGALYLSAGDGASFNHVDYGQDGGTVINPSTGQPYTPKNVCGDPPQPVGGTQTTPTAEGGALRSQSLRRPSGEPVVLNGAILRLDPDTGAALPDNPLFASSDPHARRIVAYGLRNPFRFTLRPGTREVWVGDAGWQTWEEINRIEDPLSSVVRNFGWPCNEGSGRQGGYEGADLNLCESLYTEGSATGPFLAYGHGSQVVPGETCPTGGSSIAGLAFYGGGSYPASYHGALFFADYSRRCIWAVMPDGAGVPDPGERITFGAGLDGGAVNLETGPGGDLFYVDYDQGRIQRIQYFSTNHAPTAVATASPTSGPAPLTVQFDGSGSTDPDLGDSLSYAWDLDGDGGFDDSVAVSPSFLYSNPGAYIVRLRVSDLEGATGTSAPITISSDNTPPSATITLPLAGTTWKVGDVIAFSGSATDAQQGTLPASALTWTLVLLHCPPDCHEHTIQTFPGVAAGSFSAPDHEYPSYLELRLTATDAGALTDTKSVALQPQTVSLAFESLPAGAQLAVNGGSAAAPFGRTVIIGSNNSLGAPSPQPLGGVGHSFLAWSDGGGQSHNITAPASATTYRASFVNNPPVASPQSVTTGANIALAVTLTGSDIDGDPVTFAVASGPSHGTLSGTPPNLTYSPAPSYQGSDAFTFTVADAGGMTSSAATVSIDVVPALADLAVTMSDGGLTATWNQPLTYILTATSTGPAPVIGAVVSDSFPSSLGAASWSCAASAGSSCTASGTGNIADAADLLPGGVVTYTARGMVAHGTTGPILNTATVGVPAGFLDPNPVNNQATASTPVDGDLVFEDGFESEDLSAGTSTAVVAFRSGPTRPGGV